MLNMILLKLAESTTLLYKLIPLLLNLSQPLLKMKSLKILQQKIT